MIDESQPLSCFKAYDVRGRVPSELNEELAERIGLAYVAEIGPDGPVAVGRDIRSSSEAIAAATTRGLNRGGVDVKDIGLCGTEMVYHAASQPGMGGGIMVTASHNPIEYNGLKMVREGSKPIGTDTGLMEIERRARTGDFKISSQVGGVDQVDVMESYLEHLLSFVDVDVLKRRKIVVNAGNGCAGPALDALATHLPFEFVRVHHEPDATFPNGIPNPLLVENRAATADVVRSEGADIGVAWDGDFDRCFIFDERGGFIEGYYVVGLLAQPMLRKHPGAAIVYDNRMVWNTIDLVEGFGGRAVQCRTGHSFIKAKMRAEDAVYGGEMSAHHYFRDFTFSDSGMIPWMLAVTAMCETGQPLSSMVEERMKMFPCSGEINNRVGDPDRAMETLREHFSAENPAYDETDGVSLTFGDAWRFNVRKSNTEPVLRLNVETRGDAALLRAKTDEVLKVIGA